MAILFSAARFKATDKANEPISGAFLSFYATQTSTFQPIYADSALTTVLTNPVKADANGLFSEIWLDDSLSPYKVIFSSPDLNDSTVPGSVIWTILKYNNVFDANSFIDTLLPFLYPQTDAEAGMTLANQAYAPGKVDRYQVNSSPGVTNMFAGFQAAINQARKGGADVTWGDTGLYLIGDGTSSSSNVLDCTFTGAGAQYGITFRQVGCSGVNLPPSTRAGILINHSAYTVFDITGTSAFKFYDLSLVTKSTGYPKTCFLTARNSTGESNFPKFINTTVVGSFSVAVLYNYASEDGVYNGNNWQNFANDAGACVVVITASNYFKGSAAFMSSSYTTIFAGSDSCIDHQFFGGQLSMQAPSATSDVFYLDACQNLKVYGPWLANLAGRSFFYCEMANAPAGNIHLNQIQGEVGAAPSYGVLFPNTAGTPSGWDLHDVFWDVSTASVGAAGSTPVIDNLRVLNLQEANTKGIIIPGTMQNHLIDYGGTITVGTGGPGWIFGTKGNITLSSNTGTSIYDRQNGALYLRGGLTTNAGTAVAGQLTGWGTPTNGAVISNFAGSGATLSQCGQAITEIIIQLKSLGVLGA